MIQKRSESWLRDVDDKLSRATYPMDRAAAEEALKGVNIEEEDSSWYFDTIEWPVSSRDDFLDKFRRARESEAKDVTSTIERSTDTAARKM
jgi:hypothetical protein